MSLNLLRWLPSFRELDYEQQSAITDSLKPGGLLVCGPAGSGKTAITLFCGKTLQDEGKSFKIFVFTNILKDFILAGAADLKLPSDSVTTFYRWVRQQHVEQLGQPPNNSDDIFSLWTDRLIEHWTTNPRRRPHYQFVLIDEAQDFKGNVARLLHMVSANILVVADPSQSLYVTTKDFQALVQRWGPLTANRQIPRNYRNPKAVAQVAAIFLDPATGDRDEFLRRVKGRPNEMKPVWYQVETDEEQIDRIADIISQARGSVRIGILYRHRSHLEQDLARLSKRGVKTRVALPKYASLDFNDPAPVLTTVHSAKGLEFDWVILPSLNTDTWDQDPGDPKERNLFFVALTRTKGNLYLISRTGAEAPFLQEILRVDSNLLQTPMRSFAATTSSAKSDDSDDDDAPF